MASKVGEAYVLVHTRTRPLSTAQKRALKRQAGEGARGWTSAFGKEVEARADQALVGLERKLAEVFAKDDFDSLRKEFKDTATTATYLRNSLEGLRRQKRLNSREFTVLRNQVNAWEEKMIEADASIKKIADQDTFSEWLRKQEDAHRRNHVALTRRLDTEIRHHEALVTLRRRANDNLAAQWDEQFATLSRASEDQERMLADAYRMHERFVEQEEELLARRIGIHRRHLSDFDEEYRRGLTVVYDVFERNEGGANRFTRGLARMNRQVRVMPNIVGIMFGKGSRNNLLNFLGTVMRNLAMIPSTLVSIFTGVIDKVSSTVEAFTILSRSMGPMRAAMTLLRASVAGVVATLGTFAIAIGFAAFAVPALAASISMLAGVFTAWAGVLSTAILGSLVPLVPLLVAAAGGFIAIGVAVGRYYSRMQDIKEEGGQLTREMRLMDEAINWINDSMDRFTEEVAPAAASTFAILTGAAASFLDSMGPAARRGLERFNNIITGPSLAPFLKMWRDTLPNIFEQFTAGLGHLAAGLIKFFAPILPYAERLANVLYDLFLDFSAWAGSVRGQNTIAEWMERAWRAADTLWSVLGNVWGILSSLFNVGTDAAGQGFLSNLERITAEFDKWLQTEEGREALTDWFEDAAEFASNLWEILGDIGAAFQSLDTDQARDDLNRFLEILESIIETSDNVAEGLGKIRTAIGDWWGENEETKNFVKDAFNVDGATWSEIVSNMWDGISNAFTSTPARLADDLETTKQWVRSTFKVDSETWSGIASEMWEGLTDAVGSAVSSWWGENETTKEFARNLFRVDGATWVEIVSEMWTNFFDEMWGWNKHRGTENEETKAFVKNLFKVEGETWREITTAMFTGLLRAISDAGDEARKGNPTTQKFFRDLFNVEGETWGEITSNMWSGLLNALASAPGYAWRGNPQTQQVFRDLFNVEGETWEDIITNMWNGMILGIGQLATFAWKGNPETQKIFRDVFNVEGETWGEIVSNMWKGLTGAIGDLATYAWKGNPETQAMFRDLFNVEGETWGEITSNIWDGFLQGWSDLKATMDAENPHTKEMVKGLFRVDGETWAEIRSNIWNGFIEGLGDFAENSTAAEVVKVAIRDLFKVEGETWAEIGTEIWNGFIGGLEAGFNFLVVEPFQRFVQDVKNLLGIASPSTVFFAIGVDIVTGLWNGIVAMWGTFWGYVSGIFTTFITSVGTWLSSLPGIAATWLSQMWTTVSTWFSTMWSTATTWVGQLVGDVTNWVAQLPGRIATWLAIAWSNVSSWFSQMWSTATTWIAQLVSGVVTWFATLPGRIGAWLSEAWTTVSSRFREMYNSAVGWAESLVTDAVSWIAGLPGKVTSALSGLVEAVAAPFRSAYETARDWIGRITGLGGGGGITVSAAGGGSSRFASGGLVTSPTRALIGEAGPEVVVPLRRPLMQVDPSVRALSAILQGRLATASTAGGGVQSTRPQIVFSEGSIVVQTVATDVVGIAESVVDRIAVRAGI